MTSKTNISLCADQIWGVREEAILVLVEISYLVPLESRCQSLIPIFKQLANDVSKFVKMAIFQKLGPFIVSMGETNEKTEKLKELLELFIAMGDKKRNDDDAPYHCAYSFPAVLQTFGKAAWPSLAKTYLNLFKISHFKIRKTLASSIHEIAKILGPQITIQNLDFIQKAFLREKGQILQVSLKNLHEFIGVLENDDRKDFLEIVVNIVNNSNRNWRIREIVANNLSKYAELYSYSSQTLTTTLLPLLFKLLGDPVIRVKTTAASHVHTFLGILQQIKDDEKTENEPFDVLVKNILNLGSSFSYRERQTY